MEKEIIVQTWSLNKLYGSKKALSDVSLTIHRGDIYGFVGKNGAGKTTLIRVLAGVSEPTSGQFALFGKSDPKSLVEARKNMAAMIEQPAFYYNMTAEDNLKTRCMLLGKSYDLIKPRLIEVGLEEVIGSKKKAGNFSLGMRQRLGIAMAILGEPELLVLDEPTNGLDPKGIREMRELLVNLNQKHNVTILVSSHILSELSKFATTYGFIDDGVVIKEITAEELEKQSSKTLTLSFADEKEVAKAQKLLNKHFKLQIDINHNDIVIFNLENIVEVLTLLITKKLKLVDIKEKENGLEEFFINLVGGEK